jgi:hypothetical protein
MESDDLLHGAPSGSTLSGERKLAAIGMPFGLLHV